MSDHSRRTFLKATGSALGAGAVVSAPVSASGGTNERFLVDLREVSRDDVPDDVEIVHDVSEIDLLAARGDPDAVPGTASTVPDVKAYQDDSRGPAAEVTATDRENKGPAWDSGAPTNTELQWDKRAQRVGDLSERPDNRRTVQDATKGEGTRVAVVDTGVYDGHPDLADVVNDDLSENYTNDGLDFRPNGAGDHGTHVAGIIAGTNANGEGVLGTAPETEIVAHRVFTGFAENERGASTGDTIAALAAAAEKGCDAANFSVGYPPANPEEAEWVEPIREFYRRLAVYARSQDMLIVNSAGNAGVNMSREDVVSLPTEVEGIFGVSATGPIGYLWDDRQPSREDKALKKLDDPTASPAYYTNYGDGVDVSAAGGNVDLDAVEAGVEGWYYDLVYSTVVVTEYEDGAADDEDGREPPEIVDTEPGYGWKAGTSMAAPQVTGAAALVRSLRPDADVDDVASLIRETAEDAPGGETYHGAGHLDLRRLVKRAR